MIIKTTEFIKSAVKPDQYPLFTLPEVAFAGRSNVGKSSLINTLLNRKSLVKTSSKPGCTQLINFFNVNDALSFVDLPGYGYAKVSKQIRSQWGPMVETYLLNRDMLRAVILLVDIRRDPGAEEFALMGWLNTARIPCIVVLTKADKLSKQKRQNRLKLVLPKLMKSPEEIVLFSAKTRLGRNEVWHRIEQSCDIHEPEIHKGI